MAATDAAPVPAGPPPWLVGVLNVTPDSFSDGGRFLDPGAALARGRELRADGAALVEVGGESTAPGSRPLDAGAELARVESVVAGLAKQLPVAVDTYHARTAARCLELGAVAINDVSALRAEPDLARVAAGAGCLLVLMHAKDGPLPHATAGPGRGPYADVAAEVGDFLLARAGAALAAGVAEARVVLDPGAGRFLSPDPEDSWRLLEGWARLVERLRPFPVMVATSRKGFLRAPPGARDALSQLTGLVAVARGASYLRTHEVAMARAFVEAGRRMALLPPPTA